MTNALEQTRNMLFGQLLTNDVLDPAILDAIASVNRADFLPERLKGAACVDGDLHVGGARFLIAPLEFARMLQIAGITMDSKVLIIGGTNGYSSAVVAQLAKQVVLCEVNAEMRAHASAQFAALELDSVQVVAVENLTEGAPKFAPFDVILIEGTTERIPTVFSGMLAENGRLVAAERISDATLASGLSRLVEYTKINGALFRKEHMDCALPLLPGFEAKAEFTF